MYIALVFIFVLFNVTYGHPTDGTLGQASQHFTLSLLKELWKEDLKENLVISPISISMALSMAMAGSGGETEREILEGLHLSALTDPHQAFKDALTKYDNATGYKLNMGNFMFLDKSFSMLESFEELVRSYYVSSSNPLEGEYEDDPVFTLDFAGDIAHATEFINAAVSQKTLEKITELFPDGALDPSSTRLVLVNAIYFYGDWKHQFNEDHTKVQDFHLLDGTTKAVEMMWLTAALRFKHCEETNSLMVELPYTGDAIAMYLLVPNEKDGITKLHSTLASGEVNSTKLLGGLHDAQTFNLGMPKFKLEYKVELKPILTELGMKSMFNNADFSGITASEVISISDVVHKAIIEVDEKGTEAAAATAIVMQVKSGATIPSAKADHPFVFFLADRETGLILFSGAVMEPDLETHED